MWEAHVFTLWQHAPIFPERHTVLNANTILTNPTDIADTVNRTKIIKKVKKIILNADTNTVIGLSGEPGAGKTNLVKHLVGQLGGTHPPICVSSPTFTYQNVYPLPNLTVYHFDLYRVQDEGHLENIGFWDVLNKETGIVLCEWPELFSTVPNQLNFDVKITLTGSDRHYELYKYSRAIL